MRNLILGTATALAIASPAMAADLPVTGYRESYTRSSYEYRPAPRVVVEEAAPVVSERVVVRRPVVVEPAPIVVEEDYPIYAAPPLVAGPRVFAYSGPGWRGGWGYRHHFHGGW
jgi:hypothetical protein